MDVTFQQTPQLFGSFHLITVSLIFLSCLPVFLILRKLKDEAILRFLHLSGVLMVIMEVWKQWFSYTYVYGFSMWFFPWQLCSMAMYCCFLLPLFKGKGQNAILVFLSTYSLFAAIMALAVPADMLRPHILLTLHGFIYHGIMLYQSIGAILVIRKRNDLSFVKPTLMFVVMAFVAETINVVSHIVLHNDRIEPNMFNITPYYPSNQIFFHEIAVTLGIIPEIIIYLLLVILAARVLFTWETRPAKKQSKLSA